jgi:hypothetical protein
LANLEVDPLTFGEPTHPRPLDLGDVNECVLVTVVWSDEAIPLGGIEPLHRTLNHARFLYLSAPKLDDWRRPYHGLLRTAFNSQEFLLKRELRQVTANQTLVAPSIRDKSTEKLASDRATEISANGSDLHDIA